MKDENDPNVGNIPDVIEPWRTRMIEYIHSVFKDDVDDEDEEIKSEPTDSPRRRLGALPLDNNKFVFRNRRFKDIVHMIDDAPPGSWECLHFDNCEIKKGDLYLLIVVLHRTKTTLKKFSFTNSHTMNRIMMAELYALIDMSELESFRLTNVGLTSHNVVRLMDKLIHHHSKRLNEMELDFHAQPESWVKKRMEWFIRKTSVSRLFLVHPNSSSEGFDELEEELKITPAEREIRYADHTYTF